MNSQNCPHLNQEFLGITECAFTLLIFVQDDELLLQRSKVVKTIQPSETQLTISGINSLFAHTELIQGHFVWIFVGIDPVNNLMLLLTTYLRILVSVQTKLWELARDQIWIYPKEGRHTQALQTPRKPSKNGVIM